MRPGVPDVAIGSDQRARNPLVSFNTFRKATGRNRWPLDATRARFPARAQLPEDTHYCQGPSMGPPLSEQPAPAHSRARSCLGRVNDRNDIERARDCAAKVFVMGLGTRDDDHSHPRYHLFGNRIEDPAAGALRMNC